MSAHVLGTKGRADIAERRKGLRIESKSGSWHYDGPENKMYQTEHDELFASIRSGRPINNGDYMAASTLVAIMGRMAAYTGQEVTWEMALNSKEDLRSAILRLISDRDKLTLLGTNARNRTLATSTAKSIQSKYETLFSLDPRYTTILAEHSNA